MTPALTPPSGYVVPRLMRPSPRVTTFTSTERGGPFTVRRRGRSRWAACLGAALVAIAVIHLRSPSGFVLDDWFALGNATVDGAWAAPGADQWAARPGAGLTYVFVFGALRHAGATVVLQLAIAGLISWLLFVIASRWMPQAAAGCVALAWLVLPNHTSLTYWPSATNIGLALAFALLGIVMVLREPRPRVVSASLAFAVGLLCYEAVAPVVAFGVILHLRRHRSVVAATRLALPSVIAAAWMAWFWHPAKSGLSVRADLSLMFPAHFGWGVVPEVAQYPVGVVAAAAITWTLVQLAHPRRRATAGQPARLVAAGVGAIVAGTAPFFVYFYQPLGAGDRANVVASIGTALVWVGLGWLAIERLPKGLAAAAIAGCAALFVAGQIEASESWRASGQHATREFERLQRDNCTAPVVVSRGPLIRNTVAFLDASNASGLAAAACGRRVDDVVIAGELGGR